MKSELSPITKQWLEINNGTSCMSDVVDKGFDTEKNERSVGMYSMPYPVSLKIDLENKKMILTNKDGEKFETELKKDYNTFIISGEIQYIEGFEQ